MSVKALTLWQPYATAIALGLKRYETRSWATKYRGKLAIHASLKPLTISSKELATKYGILELPLGQVLLICDLEDCILMTPEFINSQPQTEKDFGDWCVGRYAWKLSNIQVLTQPLSISGHQGLWNLEMD
ncbi:MAG TPA: ASCH domain-containing protein [Alphaproteobacteria bacterium]|nr:ASCH domain-containing protein [Alphaproteobacteria bacterium]